MNPTVESAKKLVIPLVVLGSLGGLIQDLFIPLAKFGVKLGFAILVLGIVISLIDADSKLGIKIKEITDNWKWPIVVSFFILGVSVITMSKVTENSGNSEGILAANISFVKELQNSLLGIEQQIAETKALVKDNIEISERIKEDTTIIVNDTSLIKEHSEKTLTNTETIIKNTQKSPHEQLLILGFQPNDELSFINATRDLNINEFKRVMQLFRQSDYNFNKTLRMPDMVLAQDTMNNLQKADSFYSPSSIDMLNLLISLGVDLKRVDYIAKLFEKDLRTLRSPVAGSYGRETYSIGNYWEGILPIITHPQIHKAVGEDLSESLISFKLARDGNLHENRGRYTPLHYSAVFGRTEQIPLLIELGLDVNALSESGYSALGIAIERGHLETAGMLLKYGADFYSNDNAAIQISLLKTLSMLFKRDNQGRTTLLSINENLHAKFLLESLNGKNQLSAAMMKDVKQTYQKYLSHHQTLDDVTRQTWNRIKPWDSEETKELKRNEKKAYKGKETLAIESYIEFLDRLG